MLKKNMADVLSISILGVLFFVLAENSGIITLKKSKNKGMPLRCQKL